MKRIISIALVVLMLAALLSACGSDSSTANANPEGKYVTKTINGKDPVDALKDELKDSGLDMDVDAFLGMLGVDSLEELITLELKSDGTAYFVSGMLGADANGTWTQNGSTIAITIDGETVDFTLSGSELKFTIEDQEFVLVKK